MCKEAPLFAYGSFKSYDLLKIEDYLKDKYGFKSLEYTADFLWMEILNKSNNMMKT